MNKENDEMLPKYDFSSKDYSQGKYHKKFQKGYSVKIRNKNGTISEQHFTLEDGAVLLEPDVKQYFPDSNSVNKALRCLIPIISKSN